DPLEGQIKIVDNLIAGNSGNGIQLTDDASAAAVAIHYNTIKANGRYGVLNANTSAVVNATYNDWGDPDGPNTSAEVTDAFDDPVTGFEADGEGDQVSGNTTTGVATVRFDPWLGQGTPSLAVGNLSAPNRVDPNTTITVTATITNVGDGPGTLTVPVTVDGTRVTVRTVALDENASTTVSFTTTLSTPGTKTIAVGSASTTVTVGDPAALTVESVTIQDTSVTVGETVLVTATIQNTGDLAGSTTITLRDDGTVIGERNISVSGGESVTVRFTPSFATAGGHRLVVEDTTAGTVTVRTAAQTTTTTTTTTTRTTTATTTSTSTRTTTTRSTTTRASTSSTTATSPTETTTRSTTTTTGDGGPGLTVLGTVVAVVVAALLAARRMD
ncbi:MAG: CARDB domain-containing protein, partial [Halobacteriaceae archaeon]